jgi:hypothetical protein
MKMVGKQYRTNSPLESVEFFPPNDHCGYYGLVIKPWWMPKVLAYLFRNQLRVYLGWLNMSSSKKPYNNPTNERYWWIYPTDKNWTGEPKETATPMFWCELEYVGRIVDVHGKTVREPLV